MTYLPQQKPETIVQRMELERDVLTAAIDTNTYRDQHVSLYAARQALAWAIDPSSAKSPYQMIMGTQEGPEDCLDEPYHHGLGGGFPKTTGSGPIPPYRPSPSGILEESTESIIGDK